MPASFRKQQNIPPFEKGGSGGISILGFGILQIDEKVVYTFWQTFSRQTSKTSHSSGDSFFKFCV
jgi:hypothetical protein